MMHKKARCTLIARSYLPSQIIFSRQSAKLRFGMLFKDSCKVFLVRRSREEQSVSLHRLTQVVCCVDGTAR